MTTPPIEPCLNCGTCKHFAPRTRLWGDHNNPKLNGYCLLLLDQDDRTIPLQSWSYIAEQIEREYRNRKEIPTFDEIQEWIAKRNYGYLLDKGKEIYDKTVEKIHYREAWLEHQGNRFVNKNHNTCSVWETKRKGKKK